MQIEIVPCLCTRIPAGHLWALISRGSVFCLPLVLQSSYWGGAENGYSVQRQFARRWPENAREGMFKLLQEESHVSELRVLAKPLLFEVKADNERLGYLQTSGCFRIIWYVSHPCFHSLLWAWAQRAFTALPTPMTIFQMFWNNIKWPSLPLRGL